MPGKLYLVATPIGNLEDITHRALRILREAHVVAAEDTRVTRKLMSHYDIKTRLISYHEHSGPAATFALVRQLEYGDSVALVTDAGTPAISDPGAELVRAAIVAGIDVVPIPGACAAIAGLIASGLPAARFLFEGFLPRTRSSRLERLAALSSQTRTVIIYEAANRAADTLAEIATAFGSERNACLARELTKLHEEYRRGSLAQLVAECVVNPPRGECMLIIEGRPEGEQIADAAMSASETEGRMDLIKRLAKEAGVDRRSLYQAIIKLKESASESEIER